ncbi:2-amino-4-hydroxy-6-hydroxymethyldihydropteridine diphosphokinase [Litoribrevibacter albus]|uniref:2-amino-4-hydroxy-6-hydroxymethyldihydropteridine pyrophosphokinase n=1 Tax=Litoribrevibacter albus TaxID=1473156 RepID=A0AA37SGE4_9GAMM|nr:2-amino-4-hydroxy-6-hydroxymethyldihydropteridine diphosphokinase [Litoribrevibacter albus]GLQ33664.1 2-amino-4-hydroxy-6-hydroxymethyldihydropteridine pyrophosphokinase [Litoribrevibacter albus]
MINVAYIGMGSNLDNPIDQLKSASQALLDHSDIESIEFSQVYNTTPIGPQDQPNYANAAARLTTRLSAIELLDLLQSIENAHGRVRTIRWGARTLDLDILLFNQDTISSERLIVPHCQMKFRNFVLIPLSDLSPNLQLPDGSCLPELLEACPENAIQSFPEISLP